MSAEFFPEPPNGSGAAAVMKAADDAAATLAEAREAVAENHELRCRIEEYEWDHKDDRPAITGKAADHG